MRTAVLGGTYNPVHIGHIFLAEELLCEYGYERVLMIPSYKPPHKEIDGAIDGLVRCEMLRRGVAGYENILVDDIEIQRKGYSYSIDTVRALREKYECTGKIGFVIGDDLLEGFSRWKSPDELAAEVDLLVAHRTTEDRCSFTYPHRYISNKLFVLSSSEIRRRVAKGMAYRQLVTEGVYQYIKEKGLYVS